MAEQNAVTPQCSKCPDCGFTNTARDSRCARCRYPLTDEAAAATEGPKTPVPALRPSTWFATLSVEKRTVILAEAIFVSVLGSAIAVAPLCGPGDGTLCALLCVSVLIVLYVPPWIILRPFGMDHLRYFGDYHGDDYWYGLLGLLLILILDATLVAALAFAAARLKIFLTQDETRDGME
jgi:hypothetical protein